MWFAPDVYWIQFGELDPVAVIQHYAGRCPLVHLKDMTAGPTRILAAAEAAGVERYSVEEDWTARRPLEAAALSLRHFKTWGKM